MSSDSDRPPEPDFENGLEGQKLYLILRKAIEDAMMSVLGTLVLVVIAFLFVYAGAIVFFTGPDPEGAVIGIVIILIGFYLGAVSLGVIRPVREWF